MTEHVCDKYVIACEGTIDECVVCEDCYVPAESDEILLALNATKRLSAKIALQAVRGYGSGWVVSEIPKREIIEGLKAYADILEPK